MGDTYWAYLTCEGTGNPPPVFVSACSTASIGSSWSHPMGGFTSINCQICFDKTSDGLNSTECVSAGNMDLEDRCDCSDMTPPTIIGGSWSKAVPKCAGKVSSYDFGGGTEAAGMCYTCDETCPACGWWSDPRTNCPDGEKSAVVGACGSNTCYDCVPKDCGDCGWLSTTDCPTGEVSVSAGQCGTNDCYECVTDPGPCADAGYSATNVTGYCTAVQHTYTPAATAAAPNPDPVTVTCYDCSTPDCMTNHSQYPAGYACPPPDSPDLTEATNHPHWDGDQLYYCVTCDYPPPPAASFAPVGPMGSMAFTG